ncbi:uncharacterized protein LOC136087954 [Hydra vulgaris]|uniref:Uncharacterized protein LOC136087954 n=1 Tax=Hydra vulgaris TaxID=6087 RepID=A0ABM4D0A0_HYDVU
MSWTLNKSKINYPAVEKEAVAIIEAVRKWQHLLLRNQFQLITDQRSLAFMFDNRKKTKIKNSKIQCWRMELAEFSYTISYRPGSDNVVPYACLLCTITLILVLCNLSDIHNCLCHPGVNCMLHSVKSKNLPFSTEEVKKVCSNCHICSELKPKFYRSANVSELIKSIRPMDRVSIVIDEYSRYPFAIPCPDISSTTVEKCLDQIFSFCGFPTYIHSDRGSSFISNELKSYLTQKGIATSNSTPYHPISNGQVERYNESTVSLQDLAPYSVPQEKSYNINENRIIESHDNVNAEVFNVNRSPSPKSHDNVTAQVFNVNKNPSPKITSEISVKVNKPINKSFNDVLRRSTRTCKVPVKFDDFILN